jgi:hypothetical protein
MYCSHLIPSLLAVALTLGATEIAAREGGGHGGGGFRGADVRGTNEFKEFDREAQLWKDNQPYWGGNGGYSDPYAVPEYYEQDAQALDKFDQEFPVDDY